MDPVEFIPLRRDTEAIQIPAGTRVTLPAGSDIRIMQELGGSYTVAWDGGLARIDGKDADALGLEVKIAPRTSTPGGPPLTREQLTDQIWQQLRTVYDPEISVNVVDLGLIYDCHVEPVADGGHRVDVKMTLTAPGCGMGEVLRQDAQSKVLALEGVEDVNVDLVWDPPWNQAMMTDAARLQLGLM